MLQEYLCDGKNSNHLYGRKHLGEGRYYQRGICKGIAVGDEFVSYLAPTAVLKVDKLLTVRDAKGVFRNPDGAKDAYYEAELVDETFSHNSEILFNVGS